MTKTVEFYFDVGSPAAYLAFQRLPGICKAARATLDFKPMLLGGVFQATGNQSPMNVPAKGRYMMDDLERFARRHQLPFRHNPYFPINTLTLMRGATGLQTARAGPAAALRRSGVPRHLGRGPGHERSRRGGRRAARRRLRRRRRCWRWPATPRSRNG